MAKPPLDLEVQFRDPDGTNGKTFTHNATNEDNQITVGKLTTKIGTGFESAEATINRDMRYTYGSPRIMQEMIVRGAEQSAWEGRVDRVPPSRADSVSASGWYQATRDTGGVAEVYIHADISEWQAEPTERKAAFLTNNYAPQDGGVDSGSIVCVLASPPWTNPGVPTTGICYIAPPGVGLASLTASAQRTWAGGWDHTNATFAAYAGLDDDPSSFRTGDLTSDFSASVNTAYSVSVTSTASTRRYAWFECSYESTLATGDSVERGVRFSDVTVKGNHGLSNIYASEVIKHVVGKYCPLLTADSTTVYDTTYAIGHLVFDGAKVEDVLLRCNAFHLFEIAVWEDRKLWFQPAPSLDDYDYELNIFEGDDLTPSGPEVDEDEPANGVWVYYTDVSTGRRERVGPYGTAAPYDTAGDTSLLVSTDENPVNRAGQTRFPPLELTNPATRADAIVLGALWLSEKQIPTTVGQGVARGHVKNRAGQWVPAWSIRAGDRVKYTHETGVIRRVYSTSYDPQTHTNDLAFERPPSTVEGVFERQSVALQAKGIK